MPRPFSAGQATTFAQRFLDSYCASGFGTLSKREIDLLVLRLLIDCQGVDAEHDPQGLSRQLRLPLSKVKALLYELHLRDKGKDAGWVVREVSALLTRSKLSASGKEGAKSYRIEVGVSDRLLREEIEALLHRDGHFPDYSFSHEILRLTPEAYTTLIERLLPEAERTALLASLKKEAHKAKHKADDSSLLHVAVTAFLDRFSGTVGQRVGDLSVNAVTNSIAWMIDHGHQFFS